MSIILLPQCGELVVLYRRSSKGSLLLSIGAQIIERRERNESFLSLTGNKSLYTLAVRYQAA